MQTKEELEKLTVQLLKEKLKSRKLAISGTKAELINRLHESLVAEEKLLEAAGISDVDLSSVNVDEVLGLDTDTSILDKKDESPTKSDKSAPVVQEKPKESKAVIPDKAVIAPKKDEGLKDANGDASKAEAGDSSKTMLKNAVKLGLPISEDRKVLRAQRFGAVSMESDDKMSKRAARFGISVTNTDSKNEPEDKEKILKRAQRFGIPVKEGGAGNAAATPEVLEKRAKRFGLPAEGDMDEKKKARIAKFGIVTE